jgi:hypothetical protein
MYFDTQVSWPEARLICMSKGAYLVAIESAAENDVVAGLSGSVDIWSGLTDQVVEGDYQWDLGYAGTAPLGGYRNWLDGGPNEKDCFLVRGGGGTWEGKNCDEGHRFVCERPD